MLRKEWRFIFVLAMSAAAWSAAYLLFVSESCLAHCRLKLWVNFLCRSEGSSSVRVGGDAVLLNRWLDQRGAT
jgi:hypothetical protein